MPKPGKVIHPHQIGPFTQIAPSYRMCHEADMHEAMEVPVVSVEVLSDPPREDAPWSKRQAEHGVANVTWEGTVQEGGFTDWSKLMQTKPLAAETMLPDGRIMYFDLVARDGLGFIGEGTFLHHEHRRRIMEGID